MKASEKDIKLASRAAKAMLLKAIEIIGDADPDIADDRGNLLLCIAIGIMLNHTRNIDEKISRIVVKNWIENMEAGHIRLH